MPHIIRTEVTEKRGANRIPLDAIYHCITCANEGEVRLDKKGHPFWRCPFCGLRVFFAGAMAEYGFLIQQAILRKNGAYLKRAVVEADYQERKARARLLRDRKRKESREREDRELGLSTLNLASPTPSSPSSRNSHISTPSSRGSHAR